MISCKNCLNLKTIPVSKRTNPRTIKLGPSRMVAKCVKGKLLDHFGLDKEFVIISGNTPQSFQPQSCEEFNDMDN